MGVGYSYNIYSYDVGSDNTTNTSSSMIVKAGTALMLGSSIAVYGEASYNQEEFMPDGGDATTGNTVIFALGFKAFF